MIASSHQAAVDEIFALIKDAWEAQGVGYPISWEDVAEDEPTVEEGKAWCKVYIRHSTSRQSTLSNQAGIRRWEQLGTVVCEIRSSPGRGLATSRASATILQNALRGARTQSGVWLRDVTQQERTIDDGWARVDISATFEYDEVK